MGQPTLLCCGAVCGGGVREGAMLLAWLLSCLKSLSHYPHSNWALLVLIPGWVGLCMFWDPVGPSNELSCEAVSFSHHCNLHKFYSQRFWGFLFLCWNPGLCGLPCSQFVPPSLSSCKCGTASCHLTLLLPCHVSSLPWLSISAPPTDLDECFFFNSLVVRLPYNSISGSSGCFCL